MKHCGIVIQSLLVGILLLPAGCGQAPVKPIDQPKRVALVLGGGGTRGFAHVGVLRELEAEKIPIHFIVGVSVGSLIGALYADEPDAFQLEWKAFQIEQKEIFDFRVLNVLNSLAGGEALRTYIDKKIKSRYLEDLKIPLYPVAVDIKNGERFVFTRGPIREAVRASASVPGIFPPVLYESHMLVDGGVLGNLAPTVARSLGADVIIAVSLSKKDQYRFDAPANTINIILESVSLMGEEMDRLNRDKADVIIEPAVGHLPITDFTRKKEMIEQGRAAAKAAIPQIKQLLNLP